MKEKPREYIELAMIYIIMAVVYIYIVHPILLDVAPFLAFQSSEGFDRHAGGLGPYTLAATLVAGVFIYYVVIKIVIEDGIISLFAFLSLLTLIFIPNRTLPEKYHPGTITQRDIEEWLSNLISLNKGN